MAALSGVWFGMPIPPRCSWCQPDSFDLHTSESWQWSNRQTADIFSDVLVFGLLPFLAIGAVSYTQPGWNRLGLYMLTMLDAVVVNFMMTEILKRGLARQRPESYFGYPDAQKYDEIASFPSGHTSAAFALIASSSVIAFKERNPLAPYMLSMGILLAGTAAYMRIAAAKHWPTDVLAGMLIGSAIGAATPFAVLGNWRLAPLTTGTGLALHIACD